MDECATNKYLAISIQKVIDEKPLEDVNDRLHSDTQCLNLQNEDYTEKMEEFHLYLDRVRMMVRPGCSQQVLNVALASMASLVKTLSNMSSEPYPLASL